MINPTVILVARPTVYLIQTFELHICRRIVYRRAVDERTEQIVRNMSLPLSWEGKKDTKPLIARKRMGTLVTDGTITHEHEKIRNGQNKIVQNSNTEETRAA